MLMTCQCRARWNRVWRQTHPQPWISLFEVPSTQRKVREPPPQRKDASPNRNQTNSSTVSELSGCSEKTNTWEERRQDSKFARSQQLRHHIATSPNDNCPNIAGIHWPGYATLYSGLVGGDRSLTTAHRRLANCLFDQVYSLPSRHLNRSRGETASIYTKYV